MLETVLAVVGAGVAVAVTAVTSVLAYNVVRPWSSKAGFFLGMISSQLQPPLVAFNLTVLAAVSFALPTVALLSPVLTACWAVGAVTWGVMLYDFAVAHHQPDAWSSSSSSSSSLASPRPPLRSVFRFLCCLFPPLWLFDSMRRVKMKRDLLYSTVVLADGSSFELRLDVLIPRNAAKLGRKLPCICYVHGGGWVTGSKTHVGPFITREMAANGWVVFSIDYRLSCFKEQRRVDAKFPDHIIDVKRAIQWVRKHAPEFGGDPEMLVIVGGSAGGHLASLASLTPSHEGWHSELDVDHLHVQGCISIYGVSDFADQEGQWKQHDKDHNNAHPDPTKCSSMVSFLGKYVMKEKLEDNKHLFLDASPLHHARSSKLDDPPPFLIIHGDRDIVVPVRESELLRDALQKNHDTSYVEIRGGHHSFDTLPGPRGFAASDAIATWLARLLEKKDKRQ